MDAELTEEFPGAHCDCDLENAQSMSLTDLEKYTDFHPGVKSYADPVWVEAENGERHPPYHVLVLPRRLPLP